MVAAWLASCADKSRSGRKLLAALGCSAPLSMGANSGKAMTPKIIRNTLLGVFRPGCTLPTAPARSTLSVGVSCSSALSWRNVRRLLLLSLSLPLAYYLLCRLGTHVRVSGTSAPVAYLPSVGDHGNGFSLLRGVDNAGFRTGDKEHAK